MISVPLIAAMIAAAGSAEAQGLPDIDIKAHCRDVGGSKKRIAACIGSESYARLWLETRRIDPHVLYACSHTLDLLRSGYVLLRSCVIAKSRYDAVPLRAMAIQLWLRNALRLSSTAIPMRQRKTVLAMMRGEDPFG